MAHGRRERHLRVVSGSTLPVYALPAVEVTREEFRRAQIKAGLACNGDLAALARRAVADFDPVPVTPRVCPECHKGTRWLPSRVSVSIHDVTVLGVPTVTCAACAAQLPPPVSLMAALEEILTGQDTGVISFEELL